MKLSTRVILLISTLFFASTFVYAKTEKIELRDFDSKAAKKLVKENGALLLDVRTLQEFNEIHLPGAERIDVSELEGKIDEVKKLTKNNMEQPIVIYCRSGGRAGRAKEILQKAGFKNVMNLGGYSNWNKDQ